MSAVEISELSFSYHSRPSPVLSGLSLKINEGEFVGLVGRTGCGKSTLLLTLNGIIPQMVRGNFVGTVRVMGKDTSSTPVHELAKSVAFVFQDPDDQIFSSTLNDEILFGLSNTNVPRQEAEKRAAEALKKVGLEEYSDADPHELSFGQKQKLAFACAIALDPDILVLDEPASSLDYASAEEAYSMLKELNSAGKTIIVAEHDTDRLSERVSRVIFLDKGRIAADGGPSLLADPKLEKAGIKVPCAARVSKELGRKEVGLGALLYGLRKKRG